MRKVDMEARNASQPVRISEYDEFMANNMEKLSSVKRHGYSSNSDDVWGALRKTAGRCLVGTGFDVTVSVVVLANIGLLIYETDKVSLGENVPGWVTWANRTLLVFYVFELTLRLYVFRYLYFLETHNWFDLIVVCVDVVIDAIVLIVGDGQQMPSIIILRSFKLARLTRCRRVLRVSPELYLMVSGLGAAFKTILWGMVLLIMALLLCSILAVQMIHPLSKDVTNRGGYEDCERCKRAYETVSAAFLTFMQQIVQGDSWGSTTIPIVEEHPLSIVFFFFVTCTVAFVVLNLILAVVLDGAAAARRDTDHEYAMEKEKEFKLAKCRMLYVCQKLDADKSGDLTKTEIKDGYRTNKRFKDAMRVMDLGEEDMDAVFALLDTDKSGSVSYSEFVEQLFKLKNSDSRTLLVFLKYYVTELSHRVHDSDIQINSKLSDLQNVLERIVGVQSCDDPDITAEDASPPYISQMQDSKQLVPSVANSIDMRSEFDRMVETLQELLSCGKRNEDTIKKLHTDFVAEFPRSHPPSSSFSILAPSKDPGNDFVLSSVSQTLLASPAAVLPGRDSLQAPQTPPHRKPSIPAELPCSGCAGISESNRNGSWDGLAQRAGTSCDRGSCGQHRGIIMQEQS